MAEKAKDAKAEADAKNAKTAEEAKTLLASMSRSDLLKLSNIWQHEKPVSIDTVDTRLGTLDQETWETIYE